LGKKIAEGEGGTIDEKNRKESLIRRRKKPDKVHDNFFFQGKLTKEM